MNINQRHRKPVEIVSCGVIVFTQDEGAPKYLLIRSAKHGHWDFPKGRSDPGEDDRETALRELAEETGLTAVRLLPGFRQQIFYTVKEDGRHCPKRVVYFLGEAIDADVSLSTEHTGYRWCSYGEAMKLVQFENARQLLREAEAFLNRRRP